MAYKIGEDCTACGTCIDECPVEAISSGDIYKIDPEVCTDCGSWSRTRMGGWAVAQSPILGTTITLERLRKRGYEAMLGYYEKIAPHLNEPLYTRPVRTVV